ncbi:IMPACT family protein [Pedobacter arcticus]|uniref:IMPACT family protein n=1 Tax=Pedobacter arcticus TaxID=752140 RepID=UPI0002FB2103|nr:YigZ family protein [Pedobacter arcticus]
MLFNDTYQTILNKSQGVFREKGSKFLAYAYPFKNEIKLKEILELLRNEHPKARHYCFAYRLTPDRTIFRISDDGEPSGTAGRPILNTLLSKDVTNVLVIVVRYFGGTLLGVPGLINAYKMATEDALAQAEIITKTVQDIYRIEFQYLQMNDVMKLIKEEDLEVFDQKFDLNCELKLAVNQSSVNKAIPRLAEIEDAKIQYLYTS